MCDQYYQKVQGHVHELSQIVSVDHGSYEDEYLNGIEHVHKVPGSAAAGSDLPLARHMYKQGCIRIKGDAEGEEKTVYVKCLTDTGAVTASFTHQEFIAQHPELLSKIKKKSTRVILGDGSNAKSINCEEVVELTVEFTDAKGAKHIINKGQFIVMPSLNVDMIIGLPHIVRCIPNLFIQMLVAAINDALSQQEQAIKPSEKSPPVEINNLTDQIVKGLPIQLHIKHNSLLEGECSIGDLNLISLNTNGLKHSVNGGKLEAFIKTLPVPHILALQETKIGQNSEDEYRRIFLGWGYKQVEFVSNGGKGGVAILSQLDPPFVVLNNLPYKNGDIEARSISASFENFVLVNTYKPYEGPGRDTYCRQFASNFQSYIEDLMKGTKSRNRHVVLVGDFNVAPELIDQTLNADPLGPCSTEVARKEHQTLMATGNGFRDAFRLMNPSKREYTARSNVQVWRSDKLNASEFVEKRIDMVLVSNNVKVLSAAIDTSTAEFSDHHAVITKLDVAKRSILKHQRSSRDTHINQHISWYDVERITPNLEDEKAADDSLKQQQKLENVLAALHFLQAMERTSTEELKATLVEKLMQVPAIDQMINSLHDNSDGFFVKEPPDQHSTLSDKPELNPASAPPRSKSSKQVFCNGRVTLEDDDSDDEAEERHECNATFADAGAIIEELERNNINEPWDSKPQSAAEDVNIGDPGMFGEDWNAFQHASLSETEREYFSQISRQVHPDLLKEKKWVDLFMTKGKIVWGQKIITGINGIEPLDLHIDVDSMPPEHRAKLRPPPQQIRETVKEYIATLIGTMFERSDSSITSPMTVATKKTTPFFRLAGDYRWLNQFVLMVQSYVPIILDELYRAKGWKHYADIDWKAAFHQIPLSERTSKLMTLMTVLGPLRPKFIMEGISLASNVLQNAVAEIFESLREDGIFMFDNVLMGSETTDELFEKVNKFLDICIERNVKMNFAKTWIGFDKATFFGYELSSNGYRLQSSRMEAINEIPMPGYGKNQKENITQMKSFLGFSVYFIPFVEQFATFADPLHEMTHKDFNWDKSTWERDYSKDFELFKNQLSTAMDIIFPDFSLEWIFLADASDRACSWIILQLKPMPDGTLQPQPIALGSEKFSRQARKWPINQKEAYAMVRGIKANAGILKSKPFLVATDHWNLTFIEKDPDSKLQRYMMDMQLFPIKGVLRIPGKDNPADYASRWPLPDDDTMGEREYDNAAKQGKFSKHVIDTAAPIIPSNDVVNVPLQSFNVRENDSVTTILTQAEAVFEDQDIDDSSRYKHKAKPIEYTAAQKVEIFKSCHGGNAGCWGVRRTYNEIMNLYPGNNMSYKEITDMVELCPDCQKHRITPRGSVKEPIKRVVGPFGMHEIVSIDGSPVSCPGPDQDGHTGFNLVKNQGTKVINIHPYREKTDEEAANALLLTRIRQGPFSAVLSDPGSDYTSKMVAAFNSFIDVKHQLAHIRRPQATAIEPDIKEVKRFLSAIVNHDDLRHKWGSPRVIAIVEYLINQSPDTKTGIRPYELLFGRRDSKIFDIFRKQRDELPSDFDKHEYLQILQEEFTLIHSIFHKCQQERAHQLTAKNLLKPQNKFRPGDFVFYHIEKMEKENTFQSRKLGPFEVLDQVSNDITIKSLITGAERTTDVEEVSLFMGSREDAFRLAQQDRNQVVITSIDAFRGNPDKRLTCKFLTSFIDGNRVWQSYNSIFDTKQFEDLCSTDPRLRELTLTVAERDKRRKQLNKKPLDELSIGQILYVDLRWRNHSIYQLKSMVLANKYERRWLFPVEVVELSRNKCVATVESDMLDSRWKIDRRTIEMWTYAMEAQIPQPYTVLDKAFIDSHTYVRDLTLPADWNDLTDAQAAERMDPYTV